MVLHVHPRDQKSGPSPGSQKLKEFPGISSANKDFILPSTSSRRTGAPERNVWYPRQQALSPNPRTPRFCTRTNLTDPHDRMQQQLLLCSVLALCTGSRAFASASWGGSGRRIGVRALHAAGADGGIRGGKAPLQLLLVRHGESQVRHSCCFVW